MSFSVDSSGRGYRAPGIPIAVAAAFGAVIGFVIGAIIGLQVDKEALCIGLGVATGAILLPLAVHYISQPSRTHKKAQEAFYRSRGR